MNTYKVAFLGQTKVGKSAIMERLVNGTFTEKTYSTIGASFTQLKYEGIIFDIWDTAGQERYRGLSKIYYRDTNFAILVFDLNNLESVEIIHYYIDKIKNIVEKGTCKFILIGNKIDLLNNIIFDKNKKKMDNEFYELDDYKILYLSAKNNVGIDELMKTLVNESKSFNIYKNKMDTINLDDNLKQECTKCSC